MAAESNILATVHRQLNDGTPPEEIVADLVTRGFSKNGAERIVDRALVNGQPSSWDVPPQRTSQSVPLRLVLVAAVLPGLLLLLFLGWRANQRPREAAIAAADAAQAARVRAEAADERGVSNASRINRRSDRVELAVKQLASSSPTVQCDAALQIGRLGSWENSRALSDLLSTSRSDSVKGCAAAALAALGDTATATSAYIEWINNDNPTLYRSALSGFGDMGPPVADTALPYLSNALRSPKWDIRYVTVESLSKLGPAAVPLLETASQDTDSRVRQRAMIALKPTRR